MEIAQVKVYKNGQTVAWCDENIKKAEVQLEGLPPAVAFSLPELELERTKIFEHLNGRPLSAFLNEAGIGVEMSEGEPRIEELEPVFYVHGRSETMRGKTTISAVILVHFLCPKEDLPSTRDLVPELPKIYREVSKHL